MPGCWQPILRSGLGLCTGAAAGKGTARALSGQARVPLASKGDQRSGPRRAQWAGPKTFRPPAAPRLGADALCTARDVERAARENRAHEDPMCRWRRRRRQARAARSAPDEFLSVYFAFLHLISDPPVRSGRSAQPVGPSLWAFRSSKRAQASTKVQRARVPQALQHTCRDTNTSALSVQVKKKKPNLKKGGVYSAGLLTWPTGTGHFRRGRCLGSHRRLGPKVGAIDASG
jgi:hypothetical protein